MLRTSGRGALRHAAPLDAEVSGAVTAMHAALRSAALPLPLPGTDPLRAARARALEQLDDFVLPRLAEPDAPAVVVVGGPTGVGKSTLVNTLVGHPVTEPGTLRPTTRSAVLVHHPDDAAWFGPERLLPTFARADGAAEDPHALRLVASTSLGPGLAVIDAPDFDSIDEGNRELSLRLLAAADLWLFVTSAARYSDEVPWQQLEEALARDTPVAVVMNRIPPEDRATVSAHLTRMLAERGIGTDRLFLVERGSVGADGLLPASYAAPVRRWLDGLGADEAVRTALVRQAVVGAVRRALALAEPVAVAATRQVAAVEQLLTRVDATYDAATAEIAGRLGDGTLLRGDLLAQWHAFVGRDDLLTLPETMGVLRTHLMAPDAERAAATDRLGLALDLALETLVVDHAERAAERAAASLRDGEHGDALLAWSEEDLTRPGRGLGGRARKAVSAWRRALVAQVRAEVGGDLGEVAARALAVALVLHAVSTPDREGATPALVAAARDGVRELAAGLLAEERSRWLRPVLGWSLAPDAADRLRAAALRAQRMLDAAERGGRDG